MFTKEELAVISRMFTEKKMKLEAVIGRQNDREFPNEFIINKAKKLLEPVDSALSKIKTLSS